MTSDVGRAPRDRSASGWIDYLRNQADGLAQKSAARRERRGQARGGNLDGRPLAAAGVVAGAGLVLGAALALKGGPGASRDGAAEEIIARALCHENPDTPTHRGPLWAGYRKDARRVLAALREAGFVVERS